MYAREIDGTVYDFGVSGKLIMNVLVMYDRQTESYWSQLLGEAVEGTLKGTRLDFVQSWFTTWDEWKERHPNTVALDKGGGFRVDTYTGYYQNTVTGIVSESYDDDRLPPKSFVVGLADDEGNATAYPFDTLARRPLVNDNLGEIPILVVYFAEAGTALAYDRRVDGQALTFETFDVASGEIVDRETRSTWDAWMGVAVEGELEGQVLRRVHSTRSFWFGWKDWYPETQLFAG